MLKNIPGDNIPLKAEPNVQKYSRNKIIFLYRLSQMLKNILGDNIPLKVEPNAQKYSRR